MRIGVFDSGLGGLTVVRALRKHLPGVDIIYVADTAHAPYGEKTHEQIRRFSEALPASEVAATSGAFSRGLPVLGGGRCWLCMVFPGDLALPAYRPRPGGGHGADPGADLHR